MEAHSDDGAASEDADGPSGLALFLGDAGAKAGLPGKLQRPSAAAGELARIDVLLETYSRMLRAAPRKARKSCAGLLQAGEPLVAVDRPVDTVARTSGQTRKGVTYLCPEEWLLFVERGTLVVTRHGGGGEACALGLPDAWAAALGHAELDLDAYRGYAYLRRLGYVVVCGSSDGGGPSAGPQPTPVRADRPPPALLAHSYGDVFRWLRRLAPQPALLAHVQCGRQPAVRHLPGHYDVYTPTHPYKKRAPGLPQLRMVVQR
ncbi:tRNA-splicing endonuclease subunit sen54 [Coemansia helicoidea]|uniref:tRNA-splicing endonuclease subunit sen54 n=1 Tax=Coemansia helicoidea TaxID=1286919 RepID=A0ACC1LEW9_9FUNG|nr:tRNA-splicing endonuclease subunit sen54 [Coemansia helicoidea]